MPGLTSLVILSSVDFIPANATKIMSKQLQTLDLSGIKDINEAFFLQIIEQSGKTLKSLNLSNSKISGDKLVEYNGPLSCLEKLELKGCRRLTDTGLQQILKLCGKTVRSLNLAGTNITGESLVGYSGVLACLEDLNLSLCQITDEGLLQIFKVCGKTLRNLDLAYTKQITDRGFLQIFKVCGKTLRNLNLTHTNVTGESWF